MAQFDVHRNTGSLVAQIPFVVILQSSLYSNYRRRLVAPLVIAAKLPSRAAHRLNPLFSIEGIDVQLHPLELASVPLSALGEWVTSLQDQGQLITDALDEVFSRSWG